MRRIIVIASIVLSAIVIIAMLKNSPIVSTLLWKISNKGLWLLPLVLASAVLDSVHPCSFSILLITIAFLFGIQLSRKQILQIGGVYVLGIFTVYSLIGLGILKVLHLFNTPHFMGMLGAGLLVFFGVINLFNVLFPNFPIRLKIPSIAHSPMGKLMQRSSVLAAFGLGALVGLCQFPCMGGPYLMVIGLLRDNVTYFTGFAYLMLYNVILVIPLLSVLYISADKSVVEKVQFWKKEKLQGLQFWSGLAMIIIGLLILYI